MVTSRDQVAARRDYSCYHRRLAPLLSLHPRCYYSRWFPRCSRVQRLCCVWCAHRYIWLLHDAAASTAVVVMMAVYGERTCQQAILIDWLWNGSVIVNCQGEDENRVSTRTIPIKEKLTLATIRSTLAASLVKGYPCFEALPTFCN